MAWEAVSRNMGSDQLVISLPTDHLSLANRFDIGVELKLNWEDYELLSGKRDLGGILTEAGIDPGQITSVHLPPGLRTRGKDIGMAATQENVGSINDFVQGQLQELSDVFLVMHTPRKFDYDEHLSLLSTLCDLTGFEISIENPPGTSYWSKPEDIAFFGYAGATDDRWTDLYLTIDSAHFSNPRQNPDQIKEDAVETLFDRVNRSVNADITTIRKEYRRYLDSSIAAPTPHDTELCSEKSWMSLLNTLMLAGERVKSIHFNDPNDDGTPDIEHQRGQPTLQSIREIIRSENIHVVLEPDKEEFEQPRKLGQRTEAIKDWLS